MTDERAHVLIVSMYPDRLGGAERSNALLASALAERYRITFLGVERELDDPVFDPGIPISYLIDRRRGGRAVADSGGSSALAPDDLAELQGRPSTVVDPTSDRGVDLYVETAFSEAMARWSPDVVIAKTPALLALATRHAPADAVVIGLEHNVSALRGLAGRPLADHGGDADAIVSLTDAGSEWLRLLLAPAAPVLRTIANMSDPAGFAPRSSLRQPRILAAGRFVALKQYDHLISAFALAAAHRPEWSLRLAGEGPLRAALEEQITDLGLQHRIDLLPSVRDLPREMSKASIHVMCSSQEALSRLAIESFQAGVPTVAYDSPSGPRSMFRHDDNALVVRTGDIEALAEALGRLMDDPALRRRLGDGAHASAADYEPTKVTGAWVELIDELLAERRGTPLRSLRLSRRRAAAGAHTTRGPDRTVDPLLAVRAALEATSARWCALRPTGARVRLAAESGAVRDVIAELGRRYPGGELVVASVSGTPRDVPVPTGHRYLEEYRMMDSVLRVRSAHDPSQGEVEIVRWTLSEDGTSLEVPHDRDDVRRVHLTEIGTSERRIGNHRLPTVPALAAATTTDPLAPIDAVVVAPIDDDSSGSLRHTLRSIATNAPWVRCIWLLDDVDRHWLRTDDGPVDGRPALIRVPVSTLPGMEAPAGAVRADAVMRHVHRLVDASEHLVIVPHDIVIARPVPVDRFFTPGGSTKHHLAPQGFDVVADSPDREAMAAMIVHDAIGKLPVRRSVYGVVPISRSVLAEADRLVPEGLDVPVATVVHAHLALARGRGVATAEITHVSLDLASSSFTDRAREILRDRRWDIVVLKARSLDEPSATTDHPSPDPARLFLEALLPVPAPWENDDHSPDVEPGRVHGADGGGARLPT